MKESQRKGLISVHVAVALFGFVGLFAKLVDLPAVIIVLGRVFFSSIFLWIFLRLKKQKIRLEEKSDYLWMVGAGAVLAIHWSSYMQSIQSSTVAVGTLTVSTFPIFVIFLEPYLFHEKLKKSDVFCTLMMLVGVFFIVPAFQMDNQITQGVLWGLLSAFTYAILSLMNRRFSSRYPATLASLYEQGTATIVLIPMMFVLKPVITLADAGVLMMLGIVFTAVAHSLFISGLRTVKVRIAGILSGLEPVYGTLSAFLFLKEVPSFRECLGGVIILAAVFLSTLKPEEKASDAPA